jgi:hypothetical protein
MKRIVLYALILGSVSIGCGKKKDPSLTYFDNPQAYAEYIASEHTQLLKHYDLFINGISVLPVDSVKIYKDSLCTFSSNATNRLKKLADFKRNTAFRDKAIQFFSFYNQECSSTLDEMLAIITKDSLVTENDFTRYEELALTFKQKESQLNDSLMAAQKKFAEENYLVLGK